MSDVPMGEVSVVIPTYNRADLLPRAIESALSQTRPPAEVVIVDDGSTDNTAAVVAPYIDRDPGRVRLLQVSNGGVARARNAGLAATRAEWVALLDSDDAWAPDKLAVQLAALAGRPDCLWSCTGCELIDGAGARRPGPQNFEGAFPVFRDLRVSASSYFGGAGLDPLRVTVGAGVHEAFAGDLFELLFAGNVVLPSSALIHRSVFDRVGGFDPEFRLAEETEFFHRVASVAPGVVVLSPLVRYRVAQAGSLTSSANSARLSANALQSVDRAARLRAPLPASTRKAWRSGRRTLLLRQAYAELSMYDGRAARQTAWRAGASPRTAVLVLLGSLPSGALRGMHQLKRLLAGRSTPS
jgi:glycosyltransferase involved in cell wall biosynthesis